MNTAISPNKMISNFIMTLDTLDKKGKHIPGLIMSHPGFGKTTTVRLLAKYLDYNLVTIIPSQSSSDDILGIQSVKDDKLVRLTPFWFDNMCELMKNGKRTILFIDEISTCDSYIQGPLLDLIFSRSLGQAKLPDNCFIISAGNYSSNLNNEFKMSDPLVNRFLLLNLRHSDFSINDVLENFDINENMSLTEIKEFLQISEKADITYDFNRFNNWLKTSNEISFGLTTAEEVPDIGLLGFVSLRSLNYSLQFLSEYMNTYSDDSWMRIVGDTLGKASARSDNIPYANIFKANYKTFLSIDTSDNPDIFVDFTTLMDDFAADPSRKITTEYIKKIRLSITKTNPNDITYDAFSTFNQLCKHINDSYATDRFIIAELNKLLHDSISIIK